MNFRGNSHVPMALVRRVFREIRMDQWPLKFVRSLPRDWHWSMDGSSHFLQKSERKFGELASLCSSEGLSYSTSEQMSGPTRWHMQRDALYPS